MKYKVTVTYATEADNETDALIYAPVEGVWTAMVMGDIEVTAEKVGK